MKDLETENQRLRKAIADLTLDKLILQEASRIPHLSPARRRACVVHIIDVLHVSERRVCRAIGQHRSTQRKIPRGRDDEEALTADLVALAEGYGRYGYRKISALLKAAGWLVNDKRVERIWRREGLKVLVKQPKQGQIQDNDGSCLRLRPNHRNHVWSYDFVDARTNDGRKFQMLNVVDEFTHKCLAIRRKFYIFSQSIKDIVRDLHGSRNTVRRVIRSGATSFAYARELQPLRKLRSWRDDLDRMLAANASRPARERLTLIRVFEALRVPRCAPTPSASRSARTAASLPSMDDCISSIEGRPLFLRTFSEAAIPFSASFGLTGRPVGMTGVGGFLPVRFRTHRGQSGRFNGLYVGQVGRVCVSEHDRKDPTIDRVPLLCDGLGLHRRKLGSGILQPATALRDRIAGQHDHVGGWLVRMD
ncbi:hypothetical protein QO016_002868 [Methylobacterium persicinum]|uniref:HTH-like domain-containing protein n=1 Tax=Methylobacterium persicinum TaxID=374426 RepID=A0ABU0HNT3_9HYPH|nr:hypothetical protein [Methylobacterium persicinum]GJE37644.1 hypothetical protein KHHGKMAE_1704 [Methylobacterium persicinum]